MVREKGFGTLGKNLIAVPIGTVHNIENLLYITMWDLFMKQIAHRIDKYHLRLLPAERHRQHVRMQRDLESMPIIRLIHCTQATCHPFGIAVFTTGADLRAARYGIPGAFGPFY